MESHVSPLDGAHAVARIARAPHVRRQLAQRCSRVALAKDARQAHPVVGVALGHDNQNHHAIGGTGPLHCMGQELQSRELVERVHKQGLDASAQSKIDGTVVGLDT